MNGETPTFPVGQLVFLSPFTLGPCPIPIINSSHHTTTLFSITKIHSHSPPLFLFLSLGNPNPLPFSHLVILTFSSSQVSEKKKPSMAAAKLIEPETETRNNNSKTSWEALLRRMLPPGAPLPDEDHLDYSIAVEYQGPPLPYTLPKVDPLEFDSLSISNSVSGLNSSSSMGAVSKMKPVSRLSRADTVPNDSSVNAAGPCSPDGSTSNPNLNSLFSLDSLWASGTQEPSLGIENGKSCEEEGKKRVMSVTFCSEKERESERDGDDGQSSNSGGSSVIGTGKKKKRKKRGVCRRCEKGNRLSEREMCIVCDALYCSNCVLKAMGSMPEGRKCVGCNSQPIDESKRCCLGKCSKILWKVCSPLEVKQIMKAEKECFANQLGPQQLVVNGRQLVQEELVELLGCELPPYNLKPGRYWYDKDSGLWGKDGEKPDRIISSKLNVGGKLQADASNGNTKVFINGREITKVELRMLNLAKVQCPRDTHFWVYDDGSYEEEGQNNIKGNIWAKASTRFICYMMSLPVPPGKFDGSKVDPTTSSGRLVAEYLEQGRNHKLLLLGLGGSGTSTIFKQAKFLYGNKFTPEELQDIKLMIQSNLYRYLGVLLEGRESFEEQASVEEKDTNPDAVDEVELSQDEMTTNGKKQCIYSLTPRLKKQADWLLEIMATGDHDAFFPAATREYAPLAEELWRDRAIQETYKRKEELLFLPDAAKYFLDRAVEISSNDYELSEKDILYAEGITLSNGLTSMEFSFDDRSPMSDICGENFDHPPPLTKYQLIRINLTGQQDGCKWLEMFEEVGAVIFCVALSDYDVLWEHGTATPRNKMLVSRDMFESMVNHPSFRDIPFVLLLSKFDSFKDKIIQVPLTVCEWFKDFCPVNFHHNSQSLANQAYYYVAVKFKELYAAINGRKLYVWQTRGLERSSVNEAFKFVREVLKWDEEKDEDIYGFRGDESFYNTEVSST